MDLVHTAIPHGPLWLGASVLVVDDEAPIRSIVRRTLQTQGFHVEEAEDGESALAIVQKREEPFDLVLTDLKMPRINGRQLAAVIAMYRPTVAVVCMSADPLGMPLVEPTDTPVPLLQKPFTATELYDAVRNTLSHTADLMALAEAEIARAHTGLSRLAAALEASRPTRKTIQDLVAAARELRKRES
jgi:DNA-binding NtrC family response regulator